MGVKAKSNTALWRATLWRYSQNSMCGLGAAVVLRSAGWGAISASRDSTVRVWDLDRGREVAQVYTYDNIACLSGCLARCCVGGTIAVGTKAGTLALWCVLRLP